MAKWPGNTQAARTFWNIQAAIAELGTNVSRAKIHRLGGYDEFCKAFEEVSDSDRCNVNLIREYLTSRAMWKGGPRRFTRLQTGSYREVQIVLPEEGDMTVRLIFEEVVCRGGEQWKDLMSYLRVRIKSHGASGNKTGGGT